MDFSDDNRFRGSPIPMLDGRILLGPVRGATGKDVLRELRAHGLFVARDDGALYTTRMTKEGFVIQAEGPGVRGYLVDSEGFEADETDLVYFARTLLSSSGPIRIEGSHMVDSRMRLVCRTTLEVDSEVGVRVTSWRHRVGPGLANDT